MKRYFIGIFLIILTGITLSAQEKTISNPWRFGGDFGFGMNGKATQIRVAPSVGYLLSDKLEVGGSLGYTYYKFNENTTNIFSTGIFSNYRIIPQAFARVNYEHHFGKQKSYDKTDNFNENQLWIGGGYHSRGQVGFQAGMMYNVLYNKDKSIYNSPWRPFVGVSFTF